jgi:hypothetical protein
MVNCIVHYTVHCASFQQIQLETSELDWLIVANTDCRIGPDSFHLSDAGLPWELCRKCWVPLSRSKSYPCQKLLVLLRYRRFRSTGSRPMILLQRHSRSASILQKLICTVRARRQKSSDYSQNSTSLETTTTVHAAPQVSTLDLTTRRLCELQVVSRFPVDLRYTWTDCTDTPGGQYFFRNRRWERLDQGEAGMGSRFGDICLQCRKLLEAITLVLLWIGSSYAWRLHGLCLR